MKLKYTFSDLKKYIYLIENSENNAFYIPSKDLHDYEIICHVVSESVLTKVEYRKALKDLEIANKNRFNSYRKFADKYISNPKIRSQVWKKHGKTCLNCGTTENISLDHVIPVSKGGMNDISNLQPLCKSCNSKKGSKIIDYR